MLFKMTNELPPYNFPRDFGTSVLSLKFLILP